MSFVCGCACARVHRRGTMTIDFEATSTWAGLTNLQTTDRWRQYQAQGPLRGACPKVDLGFFYYPSIGEKIRGGFATAAIHRGEKVCVVPVTSMIHEFTVGNSTIRSVKDGIDADLAAIRNKLGVSRATTAGASNGPIGKSTRGGGLFTADRLSLMVLFILRESARLRSPHAPYIAMLNSHATGSIPMLWSEDSDQWRGLNSLARSYASRSRRTAEAKYEQLVPKALARYGNVLSEGFGCTATCSRTRLERVYSKQEFLRVYAIVSARDWVLQMYGSPRPFLAPLVDFFNFGQMGLRVRFSNSDHAFVASATQDIQKGDEILFYYGTLCKEMSVNVYGFAPNGSRPCSASTRRPGTQRQIGKLRSEELAMARAKLARERRSKEMAAKSRKPSSRSSSVFGRQ
jgi:hypothetical protein